MQLRRFLTAWALGLLASGMATGLAQAATVIYDGSGIIHGQQSFVQSFNITTPGTLTVTLSNIPWLDTVSGLTGFVSSTTSVFGTPMGAGTESFNVDPGTFYAHWYGDANGPYGLGVYGIDISFQSSTVPAVPLSRSLIFLLSGLGLLFGWQGRIGPSTVAREDDEALTVS